LLRLIDAHRQYRLSLAQDQVEFIPVPAVGDTMAPIMKSIGSVLNEKLMSIEKLADVSSLDVRLVKAIVAGNYTPGPSDRQRLAAALEVAVSDIAWGHAVPVEHLRGNGPQSGRST
jgi:hypothetical protein